MLDLEKLPGAVRCCVWHRQQDAEFHHGSVLSNDDMFRKERLKVYDAHKMLCRPTSLDMIQNTSSCVQLDFSFPIMVRFSCKCKSMLYRKWWNLAMCVCYYCQVDSLTYK